MEREIERERAEKSRVFLFHGITDAKCLFTAGVNHFARNVYENRYVSRIDPSSRVE